MTFTKEDIESLLESRYGQGYAFSVLALLYPQAWGTGVALCRAAEAWCWVNMVDFQKALDSWGIDRKVAFDALGALERKSSAPRAIRALLWKADQVSLECRLCGSMNEPMRLASPCKRVRNGNLNPSPLELPPPHRS